MDVAYLEAIKWNNAISIAWFYLWIVMELTVVVNKVV
jgi:hypothetical protein